MPVWAIVIGGRVTNIVDDFVANTQSGVVVDVTDLTTKPERGWWYNGTTFRKLPHDLMAAKRSALLDLRNLRDEYLQGNVTYSGRQYDADDTSLNLLTLWGVFVLNGGMLPANFTWRDANNVDVAFTPAMLRGLWQAIKERRATIMEQSWALKKLIADATTVDEVEAIHASFP